MTFEKKQLLVLSLAAFIAVATPISAFAAVTTIDPNTEVTQPGKVTSGPLTIQSSIVQTQSEDNFLSVVVENNGEEQLAVKQALVRVDADLVKSKLQPFVKNFEAREQVVIQPHEVATINVPLTTTNPIGSPIAMQIDEVVPVGIVAQTQSGQIVKALQQVPVTSQQVSPIVAIQKSEVTQRNGIETVAVSFEKNTANVNEVVEIQHVIVQAENMQPFVAETPLILQQDQREATIYHELVNTQNQPITIPENTSVEIAVIAKLADGQMVRIEQASVERVAQFAQPQAVTINTSQIDAQSSIWTAQIDVADSSIEVRQIAEQPADAFVTIDADQARLGMERFTATVQKDSQTQYSINAQLVDVESQESADLTQMTENQPVLATINAIQDSQQRVIQSYQTVQLVA